MQRSHEWRATRLSMRNFSAPHPSRYMYARDRDAGVLHFLLLAVIILKLSI